MAIRFQCPACAQPIEVDDPWADKAVACPYCLKTVTAPSTSTLNELAQVPMATPLAGPPALAVAAPPVGAWPRRTDSNTVALAAFILACGVIACSSLAAVVFASHRIAFEEMMRTVSQSSSYLEGMRRAMEPYKGVAPAWMMLAGLFEMCALGSWLASLICGIFGVRRPQRRGLAIAALVICGSFILLMCAGQCTSAF